MLSKPETYTNDMELASLARRVAERSFVPGSLPQGDWKREHLEGKHALSVFAAQEIDWADYELKVRAEAENRRVAEALDGRSFEAHRVVFDQEGMALIVRGPWHEKLNAAAKRAGGRYVPKGAASTDCRWWFPLESAGKVEALLVRTLVKPAEKVKAEKRNAEDEETRLIRAAPPLGGLYGTVRIFDGLTKYQIWLPYVPGQGWFENFKSQLKENGARWNPSSSVWEISKAHHGVVAELLKSVPKPTPKEARVAKTSEPSPAATTARSSAVLGELGLYFHYGTIHTRPQEPVFRHKDGQIYRIASEKTGRDFDGEEDLSIICLPATEEESRAFIEAESEQERAVADEAVLRRVIGQGREVQASQPGAVEWVLRDDRNPYGDTAIGLFQPETGSWALIVRERFSDGQTSEKSFQVEEADVEAIRRNGRRKTEARESDRVFAMSADGTQM